ncbi:hypothetical protein MKY59_04270 [Paenibacillus sp. FSL W8-0426]|uniref:hypothetical protein n=1 Tax=Paenibacillus sp. FSL W8-0426 TaxID=2921714 RepID=UPI0030D8C3DA
MESEKRISIVLPIVGALIAAILGGALWAVIAAQTEKEIGLIAIVIGAMAGYAVVLFSNKRIATIHKIIAVVFSLVGILLGKYFTATYFTAELFNDTSVMDLVFTGEMISAFAENIQEYFSDPLDALFILLAVVSAWRIPGRMAKTSLASEASSGEAPRA